MLNINISAQPTKNSYFCIHAYFKIFSFVLKKKIVVCVHKKYNENAYRLSVWTSFCYFFFFN